MLSTFVGQIWVILYMEGCGVSSAEYLVDV